MNEALLVAIITFAGTVLSAILSYIGGIKAAKIRVRDPSENSGFDSSGKKGQNIRLVYIMASLAMIVLVSCIVYLQIKSPDTQESVFADGALYDSYTYIIYKNTLRGSPHVPKKIGNDERSFSVHWSSPLNHGDSTIDVSSGDGNAGIAKINQPIIVGRDVNANTLEMLESLKYSDETLNISEADTFVLKNKFGKYAIITVRNINRDIFDYNDMESGYEGTVFLSVRHCAAEFSYIIIQ